MAEPVESAVLTPHAVAEMARRGIDAAIVVNVLRAPEQRLPVRAGRDVLQSRVTVGTKTYPFRVFVDFDRVPPEVVTA